MLRDSCGVRTHSSCWKPQLLASHQGHKLNLVTSQGLLPLTFMAPKPSQSKALTPRSLLTLAPGRRFPGTT